MKDWTELLADRGFRRFWLAILCSDLGIWCVIATLPVLVAQRFGGGSALVATLAARLLPRILLAPLAGALLRRVGPAAVASRALIADGLITLLLPWCDNLLALQSAVLALGTIDVFLMPAELILLGRVVRPGQEVAGNTLFVSADKIAKVVGPVLGGFALTAGPLCGYTLTGIAIALAGVALARIPSIGVSPASGPSTHAAPSEGMRAEAVLRDFFVMLRGDRVLLGLLVCAVPYMVTLGGTRPFLFWANTEWFSGSEADWTLLVSAQGIGAVIGALVAGLTSRTALRRISIYELMLLASLLEGLCHPALLLASGVSVMVALLVLSGIPEMLGHASYIACVQQRLPSHRQVAFYSMQQPLLDIAFMFGVASAELHASGLLGLGSWWWVLSLFSTVPVVALLALHLRGGRVEPAPRRIVS